MIVRLKVVYKYTGFFGAVHKSASFREKLDGQMSGFLPLHYTP